MQISIPPEKLRKIQQDASWLMTQQIVSVREIAHFVGKTIAIIRAVPTAPLHYRALQLIMNSVVPQNYTQEEITRKFDTSLQLDQASKGDLA